MPSATLAESSPTIGAGYASLRKRGYDHHAIPSGDPEVAEQFMPMIHLGSPI